MLDTDLRHTRVVSDSLPPLVQVENVVDDLHRKRLADTASKAVEHAGHHQPRETGGSGCADEADNELSHGQHKQAMMDV